MLTKILNKVIPVIEKILMVLLAVSIVIITVQIICRYFFNSPLSWSEQISRCLFVWLTMLCVPCIFRRKGMIAFDLITEKLPYVANRICAFAVQAVIMFFAVFYLINSFLLCVETGNRVMAGVAIPQNLMYIAPVIAMFMLILVLIEQTIDMAKEMKAKGGNK